MTPTPVGMRCPECANLKSPVQRVRASTPEGPVVTYFLIALSVIVALGGIFAGASATGQDLGGVLLRDGSVSRPEIANGEVWRLVTSGFLHAGFFHLLFNMFSLYILGSIVEPAVGKGRFLLIYFVSLLCGSFGALLLEPNLPTVGASGAIFGLMGAGVIILRKRGMGLMESGLGLWIGLNLLITFTSNNISVGGHIGGLIGGTLVALILVELPERVRMPRQAAMALAAALGAVAVAGAIVISG